MVYFKNFKLRTDASGKTFLDIELLVHFDYPRIIVRYSFPAFSDYFSPDDIPSDIERE